MGTEECLFLRPAASHIMYIPASELCGVCVCVCVCVRARARTRVRKCACACVHACAVRVYMCAPACVHVCKCVCVPIAMKVCRALRLLTRRGSLCTWLQRSPGTNSRALFPCQDRRLKAGCCYQRVSTRAPNPTSIHSLLKWNSCTVGNPWLLHEAFWLPLSNLVKDGGRPLLVTTEARESFVSVVSGGIEWWHRAGIVRTTLCSRNSSAMRRVRGNDEASWKCTSYSTVQTTHLLIVR